METADDPFGTAALRRVVLDAWSASPARFREDANAEEALAVGGYAGRVLVELASNAVDAAAEQGAPARIRVRLRDGELRVANTGAPLTADGVAGLASLRASAKRDTVGAVGHFGVGFTAVLSWSAAPRVVSAGGGVQFDPALTAAAIADLHAPALNREVTRRGGSIPTLRLPWPTASTEAPPPDGYTTEVRLPLLPDAVAGLDTFLRDPDAAEDLFWALPDLVEIDLPGRVLRCSIDDDGLTVLDSGDRRTAYRTAHLSGPTPPELLADRPIEERRRATWRVTWAWPAQAGESGIDPLDPPDPPASARPVDHRAVGAPTPTDEPLTLPARLVGTFPVDDTRRRLAPGPLCDFLLERAADAYLDLVAAVEPADRWELLPGSGFPAGPVDGTLRDAILRRSEVTPLLVTAAGDLVTLREACVLPGLGAEGAALLGQAVPGLLPPQRAAALEALRGLGVGWLTWSEASAAMAGIDRAPDFWWQVYEAVATAERPPRADDLADLPVPLTGGRRVLGARGCLLPAATLRNRTGHNPAGYAATGPADDLGWPAEATTRRDVGAVGIDAGLARRAAGVVPGLRIVDPAAAHPYLERLGARPADPDALLADPEMAAALDRMRADLEDFDPDPDDVRELATLVLDLIAVGGRATRTGGVRMEPSAGTSARDTAAPQPELVLTTDDGVPWPASELLIPGADLAAVLADDIDRPPVGREWLDSYSTEVLVAAGVRAGFAVVTVDPADPSTDLSTQPALPDFDEWLDQADPAAVTGPVTAIADLDVVDEHRWPQALGLIAADREVRACLRQGPGSYSGWWLSRYARIAGHRPGHWRLPGAADLTGLYDPLPVDLDPDLARAIGVRSGLAETAATDPTELLDRLADPDRTVPASRVTALTAAVVAALADVEDPDLPSGVRTLAGTVSDADDACVLDLPWLAQVLSSDRLVPGGSVPALVARVLDLPLASATFHSPVTHAPVTQDPPVTYPPVTHDPETPTPSDTGSGPQDPELDAQRRLHRAAEAVGLDLRTVTIVSVGHLAVTVDGALVRVCWWDDGRQLLTDGSAEGVGRAVAWAAHRWRDRHLVVGAAAQNAVALAEDGVDSPTDQMLSAAQLLSTAQMLSSRAI